MGWLNLLAVHFVLTALPTAGEFNWPWALLVFAVGQPLVFFTGGLIGDALEARWYPTPELGQPGVVEVWLDKVAKGSKNLQIVLTLIAQLFANLLVILSHLGLYGQ